MEREYIVWASEYSDSGFSATQKEGYTSFNQLCEKGHKIQSTELGKWGAIDVIGQHAEPICTYYMQSQVAAVNILRIGLWEYP
jgi:hypothetical protein